MISKTAYIKQLERLHKQQTWLENLMNKEAVEQVRACEAKNRVESLQSNQRHLVKHNRI